MIGHTGKAGPRTQDSMRTQDPMKTQDPRRTQEDPEFQEDTSAITQFQFDFLHQGSSFQYLTCIRIGLYSFSLSFKFVQFKFAHFQYVSQKVVLLTKELFVKGTIFSEKYCKMEIFAQLEIRYVTFLLLMFDEF